MIVLGGTANLLPMQSFVARLADRVLDGAPPACVGIDPRIDQLPRDVAKGAHPVDRILAFLEAALPLFRGVVPAVKPNIAFFECHGPRGLEAYEQVCRWARELDLLVIGDVKRGDIGSTAEAYAGYHFEHADALTVHPYLGKDSLDPFLRACKDYGKGLFVLVRTSNPGGDEFQGKRLEDGSEVADMVARAVTDWGREVGASDCGFGPVGAVVGATRPAMLAHFREQMPEAFFLLPGVGAQGASARDLVGALDDRGLGGLVSSSRGVLACFEPGETEWRSAIEAALGRFVDDTLALRDAARSRATGAS